MLDYWVFVSSSSVNHAKLLDKVVLLIFTPTLSVWQLLLLPSMLIFDIVGIVHLCQRCVVVACGGFDLHFSDSNEIGHPFFLLSLSLSFYLFIFFGYLGFFFCVV